MLRKVKPRQYFMGKLAYGADLLQSLTEVSEKNAVHLGRLEVIGAVKKARLGYYDQQKKKYQYFEINEPMEIVSLSGNISLKEGKPMVHCHLALGKATGEVVGGHLAPGTIVFAAEFIIEAFGGPKFRRGLDEVTRLPLWEE